MRILITAGPTLEPIDPVRYLSNRSSGKMGYAIAKSALEQNYEVTLISGPTALSWPSGASGGYVETAQEMFEKVIEKVSEIDIFIMSAAVADYKPVEVLPHKKSKSGETWSLELERTPDILAYLGQQRHSNKILALAGFCLETDNHIEKARGKLEKKNADVILANDISVLGSEMFQGWLVHRDGTTACWPQMKKEEAALRYLETILQVAQESSHAAN